MLIRTIFLCACASLAALATPVAHAARPMVVDDARIVDHKACQVESWVRRDSLTTEFWALPACNPFGPFELTVGGARVPSTVAAPGASATDTVLQVKGLLQGMSDERNGWGFVAGNVHRPSVDKARNLLGDRYAYLIHSQQWAGGRWVWHFNAGAVKRVTELRTHGTAGVGFEWQAFQAAPNFQILGEAYGETTGQRFYQAGFRWWVVPDRLQLDATVGNRLDNPWLPNQRWFTIGIRVISPPFLP